MLGRGAGLANRASAGPCPPPARQLLAGRAARHGRSPMPVQVAAAEARIGEPHRASIAADEAEAGATTRVSVFSPDRAGLVLPHLRGTGGRRRFDRRCAHPHHARRHGARQSAGPGLPAPCLWRQAPARPAGESGRNGDRCGAAAALPASAPLPAPRRFQGGASVMIAPRASSRTTVVEVNARDREGLLARLALAIHGGHCRCVRPISRLMANARSTSFI